MNKTKYSILLALVVVAAGIFGLSKILHSTTDTKQLFSHRTESMELTKKNSPLYSTELSKKNKLIQAVLDIPRFQILSRAPMLRQYTKVYVFVRDQSDSSSSSGYDLHVGDVQLTELKSVEGKDLVRIPCYEVFILSYSEDHAKIWVELDATGALAQGDLHFIEGKWVPDDKFGLSLK